MSSELKSDFKIILASSSTIRKKILEDSGIKFDTVSPEVDEDYLKKSLSKKNIKEVCLALA